MRIVIELREVKVIRPILIEAEGRPDVIKEHVQKLVDITLDYLDIDREMQKG